MLSLMWGDPQFLDGGSAEDATPFFGPNWGLDEGNSVDIGGTRFYTPARYVPKALVGRGAFGVVW